MTKKENFFTRLRNCKNIEVIKRFTKYLLKKVNKTYVKNGPQDWNFCIFGTVYPMDKEMKTFWLSHS